MPAFTPNTEAGVLPGRCALLVIALLASAAGGCFSTALYDSAHRRHQGPQEVFGEPEVVYVSKDGGAVAIRARARYEPASQRKCAERVRWIVLWHPLSSAGQTLGHDAAGRKIVTVEYPDPRRSIPMQLAPQEFVAPDATPEDLPRQFQDGARFDWSDAPRFTDVSDLGRRVHRAIPYERGARRYALVLTPTRSYYRRGEWQGFDPVVAVLAIPAHVLDIVTAPIQIPFYLHALSP